MSAEEKHRVTVEIYGKKYKMRASPEMPVAYIQLLADYVDQKMKKLAQADMRLDLPKVAVLAALTISDQLHRVTASSEDSQTEIESLKLKLDRSNQHHEQEKSQLVQQQEEMKQAMSDLSQRNDELASVNAKLQQQLSEALQSKETLDHTGEKYEQLKQEYDMLKSEFNEWLELVENGKET